MQMIDRTGRPLLLCNSELSFFLLDYNGNDGLVASCETGCEALPVCLVFEMQ